MSLILIYITKGFVQAGTKDPNKWDAASARFEGEMGMLGNLINAAVVVDRLWGWITDDDGDAPQYIGWWEYEVSEPLGEWLAEAVVLNGGDWPDDDEVALVARGLAEQDILS